MRNARRCLGLAALIIASTSCGDVVRGDRSPVLLVIASLQAAPGNKPTVFGGNLLSDVITNVTSPAPCTTTNPCPTVFNDIGQVQLRLSLKDIGTPANPATPTSNNEVTITRIHIDYVRSDGRNRPGVDVPYSFDGAATGTVPTGGTLTLGFEIVRHVAKEESPLVQLIGSPTIITTIAHVTFFGHDQVGNELSVTGYIQIDFGNFGDF